jgi:hypothetical protein
MNAKTGTTDISGSRASLPIWVCVQAVVVALLFRADVFGTVVLVAVFAVTGWMFAQRGIGFSGYAVATAITAVGTYTIERLVGPDHLSPWLVALCFGCGLALSWWIAKGSNIAGQLLAECEIPALVTSFLLTFRWPQQSALDYLALFKFEDNASWVGIASQTMLTDSRPTVTGFGAFVLRAVMAGVSVGRFGFEESAKLSDSYIVVGISYQLLIFLAATFAGISLARLVPGSQRTLRIVLATSGSALAYVLLGLPLSTGHLTFIGSLVFLWAYVTLPQQLGEAARKIMFVRFALLLGAVGMWWPLAPVAMVVVVVQEAQEDWFRRLMTRIRTVNSTLPIVVILLICAVLSAIVLAAVTSLPLGIRDFFAVKGGLQPLPQNLLPLGLFGVAMLFIWRSERRGVESWILITTTATSYALLLALAAQFVGPDYAINYSPAKLLLLVAIFLGPFSLCIPAFVLRQRNGLLPIALVGCLVVSQGWLVSSWSLNNPRTVVPPTWGRSLLDITDVDQATVFCLTSQQDRRMEAYECSRHASALTNFDYEAGAAWRHMILFPGGPDVANQERVNLIADGIRSEIAENRRVVFLNLDAQFDVAEVDQWWIPGLPRTRDELVTP